MSLPLEQEIGAYRIVSQLGRGGMATVYKAYHASLDRYVAIKVLRSDLQSNPEFLARFKREAKIIAKLDHPHIIPVYDIEEVEGALYLVMRFVEGLTLREALNRFKKPLSTPAMMHIMRPVTDALAYAHQKDILHRDVKPSNIMLGSDDNVYLMDFGLALSGSEGASVASKGPVMGTPFYLSPEQAKGESLDQRTDLYSLGIVLYELLTAKLPFTGETYDAVVYHQLFTLPPLPSKINPLITPALEQVVLKALAKEKKDRFPTANAMLQALEDATQSQTKNSKQTVAAQPGQPAGNDLAEQLTMAEIGVKAVRRTWSGSGYILAVALVLLVVEVILLFPALRSEARDVLIALASSTGQGSDAVKIVVGTVAAYIATMSTQIALSKLRRRLPGIAFLFAVAFGVTLVLALVLGIIVLVLLNVF